MELGRNKRIYIKQKNTIKLKIKTEITAKSRYHSSEIKATPHDHACS